MKREFLKQTKSGVASLYIVIFATILFGVITLSFVRIMNLNTSQTSDNDLSQSAYDAALAGVEDAKLAVNRYYTCKNNHEDNCGDPFADDCDGLNKFLYGNTGEVPIRESDSMTNYSNQAYTCVILSNETEDYRGTLSSEERVLVVPIANEDERIDEKLGRIVFNWFSENNGKTLRNMDNGGYFKDGSKATVPPVMSLSLIMTNNAGFIQPEMRDRDALNVSTVVFLPSESATSDNVIVTKNALKNSAMATQGENSPFLVKCVTPGVTSKFACKATLQVKDSESDSQSYIPSNAAVYLVVSMPYGTAETSFTVEKQDASGSTISFEDVQVKVDSTGRSGDLYRRVETRLAPGGTDFPFPQFALEVGGNGNDGDEGLEKNFWVTTNCWPSGAACNNGKL